MTMNTITLNGVDYVTDEAAAANTREAVEPLLAEIADLRAQLAAVAAPRSGMCPICGSGHTGSCAGIIPSGPVTAADVQRARERVSPRFGETILPAMTIPDDGRVDAGLKERDWFETPMSLISSPPVADGIPEWSGADGGRDG